MAAEQEVAGAFQTASAARTISDRTIEVTQSAVSQVRAWQSARSQMRAWSEFADRAAFALPESFRDAANRTSKNFSYFWGNYLVITTGSALMFLLLHPSWLFLLWVLLVRVALWVALSTLFTKGGTVCSDRVVSGGLVVTFFFIWAFGAIWILFWMLIILLVVTHLHGAFRVPDDLFLNQQPSSAGVP